MTGARGGPSNGARRCTRSVILSSSFAAPRRRRSCPAPRSFWSRTFGSVNLRSPADRSLALAQIIDGRCADVDADLRHACPAPGTLMCDTSQLVSARPSAGTTVTALTASQMAALLMSLRISRSMLGSGAQDLGIGCAPLASFSIRTARAGCARRGRGRDRTASASRCAWSMWMSTARTARTSSWSATAATGRLSGSSTSTRPCARVGQQRAAPAPRTERADRRQRHQRAR